MPVKVSALMPTFNRREFIPRAIDCFLKQQFLPDWEVELVVLDDGTDQVKDLIPENPRIRYFFEQPKKNHSTKMNRCAELAQGDYLIVWDDDDFYPPTRLARQIQPLIENPKYVVSGTSTLFYYRHGTREAYRYTNQGYWIGAIAFRKDVWQGRHFDGKRTPGADNRWLQQTPKDQWCDLKDATLVCAAIHPTNDCRKNLVSSAYKKEPWETVQRILGE
jgi:glycosyltransferase involved in cell wall biosynthesis